MPSTFRSLWPRTGAIVTDSYKAEFFDAANARDRDKLDALVASGAVTTIHDSLNDQLEELVEGRTPHERLQGDALRQRVLAHVGELSVDLYGTYVFLPWRKELLHILPKDEFIEVRTSRNRYKITPAEQKHLSELRVGIVGLSVGSATALTLALEGIGGELRIADFDVLSLSNTNRLRSPVSNIGVNKAVLCAREICEINPYLPVTVYAVGLHEDNIEAFLLDGGKLDILIEECDDLFMKLFSRERARYHGIPVIMETSDKGLLDVERFDQEPHRPLFHNLIGDMDSRKLRDLSPKDRIQFQLRIVGTRDTVSPRLLAGLFEIGTTTKSWPQLASAISLVRPIPLKSYAGTRKLLVLLSQLTKHSMTSFRTRSKYGADSSAGCWYCR
jgi:molybdopterin/thiamine biosynthesis adenylyltransferase